MKKLIFLLLISGGLSAQVVIPKSTTTFSNISATGNLTVTGRSSLDNVYYYDNFNRGNSSVGSLGTPPTGQTYTISSVGTSSTQVVSNAYYSPEGQTTYAFVNAGFIIKRIGMKCSWAVGTGTASQVVAMALTPDNSTNNLSVHFYTSYKSWTLQTRQSAGAFVTVAQGTFATQLKTDGTPYSFEINIIDTTAYLNLAGTHTVCTSQKFSSLKGNYAYFEHFYNASTADVVSTIKECYASPISSYPDNYFMTPTSTDIITGVKTFSNNINVTPNNTYNLGSGSSYLANVYSVYYVCAGAMKNNAGITTVNNSVSGTTKFLQPEQGSSYKKVIIYLTAANGTASYSFPTAFVNTPIILNTTGLATAKITSLSTTSVTVTGATDTGFLIIEGY